MKVADIIEAVPALNKIMESPMSPRLAFRVGRLMKELNAILESYEVARRGLIRQFQEQGLVENGKIVESHAQGFLALMQPVLSEDVQVDVPVVTLDDLGEGLCMTPAEMLHLSWLIRDEAPLAH